jgi:hypothetical protein
MRGEGSGRPPRRRLPRRRRAPDPGYSRGPRHAWSPATQASSGGADLDLELEIEKLVQALREHGPRSAHELARDVGARFWGPGRFRRALGIARRRGRIDRRGRRYAAG